MAAFCGTADASPHARAPPVHSSDSSPEGISGARISHGAARPNSIVEARTLASEWLGKRYPDANVRSHQEYQAQPSADPRLVPAVRADQERRTPGLEAKH